MMDHINILLVEDNEGDIVLTLEALNEARITNDICVVRDGELALKHLQEASSMPDLILLDINLPKIDGLEVLRTIKNDDRFKMIPVIMLTTSCAESDILDSYANHANCFITKPVDLTCFLNVIKTIEDFWISIVKLPKKK
jgi:two-component system, chemotaxis family, response regulator Rcp1